MTTHILALEKDLFFSVKMRDTLRHYDIEVKTVRNLSAFEESLTAKDEEELALVIVNIATIGVDWETAIRKARISGSASACFRFTYGFRGTLKSSRGRSATSCRQFKIYQRHASFGTTYAR